MHKVLPVITKVTVQIPPVTGYSNTSEVKVLKYLLLKIIVGVRIVLLFMIMNIDNILVFIRLKTNHL